MKYIYIVLSLSLFVFYSCSNKSDSKVEGSIDVEENLKNKKQLYLLSNLKDTTIILEGGVNVFIPKMAFVDLNGVLVDSAEVNFTECLTIESMLMEKLTTASDSALLISNGMLKIEVYKNEELLFLGKEKELKVYFPRKENTENYKLFYGGKTSEDSSINWKIAFDRNDAKQKKIITRKIINKIHFTGYSTRINDFVPKYKFNDPNQKDNIFEYFRNNFTPSNSSIEWLASNHQLTESSDTDGLHITINYNEDLTLKNIKHSNENALFVSELEAFVRSMPKINYGTVRNYDLDNPKLSFTIYANTELDKENYAMQFEESIQENGVSAVNKEDINYYIYSVSQLGWINCDRFYEYSDIIDLYVSEQNSYDLQFNLIFKNFKSILNPSKFKEKIIFKGIPASESVKLIGYEFVGDKVLFSSNDFITNQERIEVKDVELISFVDFKSRLKKLNQ